MMGMEDCLEGIESPLVLGYSVFAQGRDPVALPYPKQDGEERPRGRSFHHGRFIMNLRRKAMSVVDCVKESTVTSLVERDGRVVGVDWRSKTGERGSSFADIVFVCDGLFSNLREQFTGAPVTHSSKFFGLVMPNAAADLPFPNHGHVLLLKPTPTLIYPISHSGDVRILIDVPEPVPAQSELKEYFLRVTAPQLPASLLPLFLRALEKETVFRSMPCGKLHSDPSFRPGAMMLGDGFNVKKTEGDNFFKLIYF
jgi:squalene monooxygenase